MSLREFLVKDCQNNKQIKDCSWCKYEDECDQTHINLIIKALGQWLAIKYKECYDPHEEFVCPPHVTIDQLQREVATNESQSTSEVKP